MLVNLERALSAQRMRIGMVLRALLPRPTEVPCPSVPQSLFPDCEGQANQNPRSRICGSPELHFTTQSNAGAAPIALRPSSPAPLPLRRPPFFAAPFLISEAPL